MINYSNISNSLGCAVDEGLELNIPSELSGIEDFVDHNDAESEMYFSHTDHLGSSSFITDAGGEAVQHLQYLPFGESFISQKVSSYDVRYKFTGKERDAETGYDYFGARYYSSELSVWLSVDPLADLRYWVSPYNYCQNDPINLMDPTGALDGEYTVDKNTGEITKISNLGDEDGVDFYYIGEISDNGAFAVDETVSIERNQDGGNINTFRIQEDKKGTISAFHIPQIEKTGFLLEPGGPSTTTSNQDKRIPEGEYDIILSKDRPGVNADKLRFPNNFVLYNNDVSWWRGITFHAGNFHSQTEGCPMPGSSFGLDNNGYLRTFDSRTKLKVINHYINSEGAENIKININNVIN